MTDELHFRKATVIETSRVATIKLQTGKTFNLPVAYATEDEMYHLDQGDEIFICMDEVSGNTLPPVLMIVPYQNGGLSISLLPDDEEYIIDNVYMISKEELDDI